MRRRQIGVVVAVVGVLAVLVAVLADPLGIGAKEGTFGWKQLVLLGIGLFAIIWGAVMARIDSDSESESPPAEQ